MHTLLTPKQTRKFKSTIHLTRENTRELHRRKSYEPNEKGISRAVERLLDHAKAELDPKNDKFNEEAYKEYLRLLEKYNIPRPTR